MTPREIAIQQGEKTYLGAVCRRSHSGLRYTINKDCVTCAKLRNQKHMRSYYPKTKLTDKYKEYQKKYQKEYSKTEVYKTRKKKYAINNKAKIAAKTRKYELAKLNRTPSWLTEDDFWLLEQAYELAALRTKMFGFPWHVDHVIPLQGMLVSGLHVPHNVQVIPAKQNQSKFNRYEIA